jgi:hypothetical protein
LTAPAAGRKEKNMSKTLKENNRSIGIWLEINNGLHLEMAQASDDGMIKVRRMDGDTVENTFTISPGDMVTMLNWFRYQKDNGNINLTF